MQLDNSDVNDQELDSSTDSETLDVTADDDVGGVAESSDADGVTDDSTLGIVRDVVAAKSDSEEASPAEAAEEGQSTTAEVETKEQDDENFSDVPFGKHPRFKRLLEKAKRFERDAQMYQNVQSFMDTNGISAEEAAEGFVIMGLMKHNPAEAWERLKPYVQGLLVASGEVLPDDLAQRVNAGEMPRDVALEVSRHRAHLESIKTGQTFAEQQAQRRQQEEHSRSLIETASSWEAERRLKDPNFEAKLVPLQKELAFIQMQEGKPNTREGVLDQLKRAYASVVPAAPQVSAASPRPRVAPKPSVSGQVKGNAQPKPQTTLDIIRAMRNGG